MKIGVSIGIVVVVLVVIIGGYFVFNGMGESANNTNVAVSGNAVKILNFAFSPSEIMIKAGENVTWINEDSAPHAIVSDFGDELVSKQLSKGESYSHSFTLVAVYTYHCSVHPSMKGKVIVQ